MDYSKAIRDVYDKALKIVSEKRKNVVPLLGKSIEKNIDIIVDKSENNKGVLTVLITLLVYKELHPEQDIRCHQSQIKGGFSGRSIDTNYITPFMKKVSFPAMAETGWLTRSLEQPYPYTLDYQGKISPASVKDAFLLLIDEVQTNGVKSEDVLLDFFVKLIRQRDSLEIELAKPHSLSISSIISLLRKHFTYSYSGQGASRLPTLAIYAAYQCMMKEVARYSDKVLCELESHTSADVQSGKIGDIEVDRAEGGAFEGVEIKHEIRITPQLIMDAYEKFKIYSTAERYYLLTTADMAFADWNGINEKINHIARIHGCQVIINGVYDTLKYYLRLLNNTAEYVDRYVELLKRDQSIKFSQKEAWNKIVSGEELE